MKMNAMNINRKSNTNRQVDTSYPSDRILTRTDWLDKFFESHSTNGFLANAIFLYVSVAINFIATFFSILTYLDPTKLAVTFITNAILLALVIGVNFTRNKACAATLLASSIINLAYSIYIGSNALGIILVVASVFSMVQLSVLDNQYRKYVSEAKAQ